MMDVNHKKVTVIGAARSGLAAADLLKRHGARVFLSEFAPREKRIQALERLQKASIPCEFGGHSERVFDADFWVISPGVPIDVPLLKEAKSRGLSIFSELEVGSWFCRAPMVAVTGSNGKSTVTTLLGELFRQDERPCVVAGNIGDSFTGRVEETVPEGVAVLEVSSFQLEAVATFHPKVALLLNLTPDHLDRHGTLDHYGDIKARIFARQTPQDVLIYNGCDPRVSRLAQKAIGRTIPFGVESSEEGAFIRDETLILKLEGREESVISVADIRIKGEHNVANSLAAALAARVMGARVESIRQTLKSFPGLPHRMEPVADAGGVLWVNDSKATNTDSMRYALGSYNRPLVLIAGGRDKDSDFTVLRPLIEEKVKTVILVGEASEKIGKAFQGAAPQVRAESLENAIQLAQANAQPGDVVLLSPGCASFDMFKSFEDRGDQFRARVKELVKGDQS